MVRRKKIKINESLLVSPSDAFDFGRRYNYVERVSESNYIVTANTPIIQKQNAFKSVVLVGNVVSQNKIYYPLGILRNFIDVAYPLLKEKRLLGYLEHPQDESVSYYLANPKDGFFQLTHYVYSLELNDDRIIGTFVLFDNVADAMQVKSWLQERVVFGVSIRADVEVVETNITELIRNGFKVNRRFYLEQENIPINDDHTKVLRATNFIKVYGIDITLNPSVKLANVIYTNPKDIL